MADPSEAAKALRLALKYDQAGSTEPALKWARKSVAIHPTPQAEALLAKLEKGGAGGGSEAGGSGGPAAAAPSASSSSTDRTTAEGGEGLRNRNAPRASTAANGSSAPAAATSSSSSSASKPAAASGSTSSSTSKDFTPAQVELVKKIRSSGGDLYKVLGLEKGADESAIKKAYRKLALQLHPDKNRAPGADEAFKLVSKAFTTLSDGDKRAFYDRYGDEAAARAAGAGGGGGFGRPGGGMQPGFRGGPMFGEEIDPQDLFNMFFGGGMGGGGGGFGGTTFHFGGPGMTFGTAGGGPAFRAGRAGAGRRAGEQGGPADRSSTLLQLMPLLVLVFFSLLSYLPALFTQSDPSFAFAPTGALRSQRFTTQRGVSYFVDEARWKLHPFVTGESTSNGGMKGFEGRVERSYKNSLATQCQTIREYQERRLQNTMGFFGIGADPEAARRIREERHEVCERLQDWGIYM